MQMLHTLLVLLLFVARASDLIYEEVFTSSTKSLGLKLSQDLHILGFGPRSPAQARGVKTGDVLIKVNQEDLEASGPQGLSKLSSLLRSLPFPRTFRFKRIGAGSNEPSSPPLTDTTTIGTTTGTTTGTTQRTETTRDEGATAAVNRRGISVFKYNAIFPRNERVGLHFDPALTVTGFAHGSHGEVYAAEKMNNVQVGDVLHSINHDAEIVENILTKRWPSIAALQVIESLQPPLLLCFTRVIQEKTSIEQQLEEMNQANHFSRDPADATSSSSSSSSSSSPRALNPVHLGDHVDIALEGTHHNHDSGNYNHHTSNMYQIMRAKYGPPPSCRRSPMRAVQPLDGCGGIANAKDLKGAYAVVVRGGCNFIDKTRAVQHAGAIGLIVINQGGGVLVNMPGAQFGMDDMNDIVIPSVMVEYKAYEVIFKELVAEESGRSHRWTSRIVLIDGACIGKNMKEVDQDAGGEGEGEGDGEEDGGEGGEGQGRGYRVGPRGRALYEHHERSKEYHPIVGGLMIIHLGLSHPSQSMRLEYLMSSYGQVYTQEHENVDFALKWENMSVVCHSGWVGAQNEQHRLGQEQQRQEKEERSPANTLIVTHVPYPSNDPLCGIQEMIIHVQHAGYGGVVFVTESTMLSRMEHLEEGVKGAWWGNEEKKKTEKINGVHRPNTIKIPILTLSLGDGTRIKQAFQVDRTDGKEDILCTLYPDREVVRAWKELKILSDPHQWPYSNDGRRRLMHRMFKLAPKSSSRTEAITRCAENAEHHYYQETVQQRRDEL